jgi:hypothetical protein
VSGPPHRGIVSWEPSPKDPVAAQTKHEARYRGSIGWAIVGWIGVAAAVFATDQVLRLPELAGWVALGGIIVGGWFGGTRGGLNGRREWVTFGLALSMIIFLVIGFGSCVYAMALYG